jgi:hypothetical protein
LLFARFQAPSIESEIMESMASDQICNESYGANLATIVMRGGQRNSEKKFILFLNQYEQKAAVVAISSRS